MSGLSVYFSVLHINGSNLLDTKTDHTFHMNVSCIHTSSSLKALLFSMPCSLWISYGERLPLDLDLYR